jgi:transcriptional regulator with XRE-family HTH domain
MKERLALILQQENLTAGKLAEMLGVQPSGISHLLSGRNKPNFDFVAKLLKRFPAINPDWLILGEGEMYRKAAQEPYSAEKELSLSDAKGFFAPDMAPPKAVAGEKIGRVNRPDGEIRLGEKVIERIVFFYSDHSFSTYSKE